MTPYPLHTHALSIGYASRLGGCPLVEPLDLTLRPGELVCLLGPNGAGKSTLMRTLVGMQRPLAGEIHIGGQPLADLSPNALARQVSIVLTDRINVGMLSAYDLVALGRYPYTSWSGRLTARDENMITWALSAVGATELSQRLVNELSDGERQKVLIARALAQDPQMMLLDEPTAFLDLPRRVEIMRILRQLAHDEGRAILLSTHDLDLALRSADKIWLLPKGGRLESGTPEDLVLSGAFEATFASEGITFDRISGAFHITRPATRPVVLNGKGVRRIWTQRALEREGYSVAEREAASVVHITVRREGWELRTLQGTAVCFSLAELHAELQTLKPDQFAPQKERHADPELQLRQ